MVKIAVVEDDREEAEQFEYLLKKYYLEKQEEYTVSVFPNPILFLESYRHDYDLIFLDIELPDIDGMEVARRLRRIDQDVLLIFVTRMARFAINGYEVNALDYMVKPIAYDFLKMKMARVEERLRNTSEAILVTQQSGAHRLLLREIQYIEVQGHTLYFHLEKEIVRGGGSLTEMEDQLKEKGFLRCNKCYLVNQRHIALVQGYTVKMDNGEQLQISRPRKTAFMSELAEIMGGQ